MNPLGTVDITNVMVQGPLTHWPLGDFSWTFRNCFQANFSHRWLRYLVKYVFTSMSLALTDDKSTLVQVMAWCHQATSHYLSQCWPRSLWPYDVTRPQWVKTSSYILCMILYGALQRLRQNILHFEHTKDTQYLALMGDLWSVYEYAEQCWPSSVITGQYCGQEYCPCSNGTWHYTRIYQLIDSSPKHDCQNQDHGPLTHLPLDKMAAILADNIFQLHFLEWKW